MVKANQLAKTLFTAVALTWLTGGVLVGTGCSAKEESAEEKPKSKSVVTEPGTIGKIQGEAQLKQVLDAERDAVVVLDLYADWCGPCRYLSPILRKLALTRRNKARIYKIDVDKNQGLARTFGASGIPLVVFMRGGKVVHRMMGVQQQHAYEQAIDELYAMRN